MSRISCVMLATGKPSPISGQNKLLLRFTQDTLVRRTALEVLNIPFEEVIVVTGRDSEEVAAEVKDLPLKVVHHSSFQIEPHTSLHIALSSLRKYQDGFFVCHGDHVEIDSDILNDMIRLFDMHEGKKIICTDDHEKGSTPVLIPREFLPELLQHEGDDDGYSYLLKKYLLRIAKVTAVQISEPDYQNIAEAESLMMVAQHG
ncbi:nucleotidyltransferase family protein [Bdellovibrio sp. HCB209]|uniref:nucleotidyltransferase family protein n=1 Tax=Bdellovibrio sp. HCB209 TaxID=3394354 RepID=UPI0039B4E544